MGKMQRDKGARFERECVKQLNFHDIAAKRVPLSGATWLKGDIIAEIKGEEWTLELKKRADGFKQIYDWSKDVDALIIGADKKKPIICIDLDDFCDLVKNGKD